MAYSKKTVFKKAKDLIGKDRHLVYIEDLCLDLGMSKQTFYKLFPLESNELDEIKELLSQNKAKIKRRMRKNWEDKDASASTQIALYKLLATKEEREILTDKKEQKDDQTPTIKIENYIPLNNGSNDSE